VGRALRGLALLLLLVALPGGAQEPRFELGVRYWLSRGTHQFSHNAQGVDARLGNPTSILTYEDTDAHALEIHGRSELPARWFVRGNVGLGKVQRGSFDDEDYDAGQVKVSDTTSSVRSDRLSYFTLEGGREIWRNAGAATRLEAFAGFQQWSETLEAFGAQATVGPISVPDRTLAITNDVRWRSLRAGVGLRTQLRPATRLSADLALVPYSEVRNEDSHHLRADLGPTPNVITTGTGGGVQLDVELRQALRRRVELGIGLRHWHLRSTDAEVTLAGVTVPVNEIETRRTGLIVTLSGRW
jgi:hypothetical protein